MPSSSLWNLWNCNLDRQRTNRRVAQLPRANISLRHEIYIQRCTLFARNGFEARKTFDRKFRNETNRPCWDANTIDSRISVSLLRLLNIRSRKKKRKTRRSFPETLLQTVYVRDLGSEYGANKGDWTRIFNSAKKKLRVLSFDSVGACFQRCFFRDD